MQATQAVNLSFAGCGFLAVYHLGAVTSLSKCAPKLYSKIRRCAGASGGALAAAVVTLDPNMVQESVKFSFELAKEVKGLPFGALTPGFSILQRVEEFLDRALPQNAHELANDRLFISVTNVDTKENQMISTYNSRSEVIQWLLCSCYIPVYAGIKAPQVNGKKYMDGGFTNNLPTCFSDGRTISLSPFCGRQDISPRDPDGLGMFVTAKNQHFQINFKNIVRGTHALFPSSSNDLELYYQKGGHDAVRFLKTHGWIEDR